MSKQYKTPLPMSLLAGWLLLCWFGRTAWASSPIDRFNEGKLEFEHKNFENAIRIVQPLLYPVIQLTQEEDIVQAREILGLSHFYLGQQNKSQEEFKHLLYLRPRHRLDPFLIPPQAVRFFEQVASDPAMKEKLGKIEQDRLERERLEAEKNKQPSKTVVRKMYLKQIETQRSRLVAFLPFGIGQFQNGHTVKGILLSTGGSLALITNIVSYSLVLALAKSDGTYSKENARLARGLRVSQYISLGVFAASWGYGAIDANIYFEPVIKGPIQPEREETEIQESRSSLPGVTGPGAGLVFSGRF